MYGSLSKYITESSFKEVIPGEKVKIAKLVIHTFSNLVKFSKLSHKFYEHSCM